MTKIEEIAEQRGVFMFEHQGLVLVHAETHWFSDEGTVLDADEEAAVDDVNEVFCDACESISKDVLRGRLRRQVDTLLDNLRAARPDRYATLGGSHEAIIAGAV